MTTALNLITPHDVESHPELPILVTLDSLLEMTKISLCAHYPETLDVEIRFATAPNPHLPAYTATILIALADGLRDAIRVHRELIARELTTAIRFAKELSPNDKQNPEF